MKILVSKDGCQLFCGSKMFYCRAAAAKMVMNMMKCVVVVVVVVVYDGVWVYMCVRR